MVDILLLLFYSGFEFGLFIILIFFFPILLTVQRDQEKCPSHCFSPSGLEDSPTPWSSAWNKLGRPSSATHQAVSLPFNLWPWGQDRWFSGLQGGWWLWGMRREMAWKQRLRLGTSALRQGFLTFWGPGTQKRGSENLTRMIKIGTRGVTGSVKPLTLVFS